MNDQIQQKVLNNLMTLYKSRGLSPEKMFENPMFRQLPIEQKIQMVKRFGEQVGSEQGKGIHWDKDDAKKLLLGLGLGALAIATVMHGKTTWNAVQAAQAAGSKVNVVGSMLMPVLTATGVVGGAASGLGDFNKSYQNKKTLFNMNTNDDNEIINYLART